MRLLSDAEFAVLRQRVMEKMTASDRTGAEKFADVITTRAVDSCIAVLMEYQAMQGSPEVSQKPE